jgi:hypothetical protein
MQIQRQHLTTMPGVLQARPADGFDVRRPNSGENGSGSHNRSFRFELRINRLKPFKGFLQNVLAKVSCKNVS